MRKSENSIVDSSERGWMAVSGDGVVLVAPGGDSGIEFDLTAQDARNIAVILVDAADRSDSAQD